MDYRCSSGRPGGLQSLCSCVSWGSEPCQPCRASPRPYALLHPVPSEQGVLWALFMRNRATDKMSLTLWWLLCLASGGSPGLQGWLKDSGFLPGWQHIPSPLIADNSTSSWALPVHWGKGAAPQPPLMFEHQLSSSSDPQQIRRSSVGSCVCRWEDALQRTDTEATRGSGWGGCELFYCFIK